MPYLPIRLVYHQRAIDKTGLIDSGSSINVLPYQTGIDLGGVWDERLPILRLSGNLANVPAYPLIINAIIGSFNSVRLAFAWTKKDDIPIILGQVNFFMEFDVCFYRNKQIFEVSLKSN